MSNYVDGQKSSDESSAIDSHSVMRSLYQVFTFDELRQMRRDVQYCRCSWVLVAEFK